MILNFHSSRTVPISDLLRKPCIVKLSARVPIFCKIVVEGQLAQTHVQQMFIGTKPLQIDYIFHPRSVTNDWETLTISAESAKSPDQEPYELLLEIQELLQQPAQKN